MVASDPTVLRAPLSVSVTDIRLSAAGDQLFRNFVVKNAVLAKHGVLVIPRGSLETDGWEAALQALRETIGDFTFSKEGRWYGMFGEPVACSRGHNAVRHPSVCTSAHRADSRSNAHLSTS